jgi:predicted oxidoreductase
MDLNTLLKPKGPKVSRVVWGFWRADQWNMETKELHDSLLKVKDLGITTLDHADIYGDYTCEGILGEVFKLDPGLRKGFQLVTKCGIKLISPNRPEHKSKIYDTSLQHILQSVDQSLTNFSTDYIDILLIHRPDPLMDIYEVAEAFNHLKKAGKVLNFGVSNFTPSQFSMLQSVLDFPLVTNQIEFSLLHYQPILEDSINYWIEKHVRPMAWSPLGGGNLFANEGSREKFVMQVLEDVKDEINPELSIEAVALAWILKHPARFIPVIGSGNIDHIFNAVKACEIELSREQWFRLLVASQEGQIP